MSTMPIIETTQNRRGLRCQVRISYGERIWRGLGWLAKLDHIYVEIHHQPAPTFSEGDAVTVHVDSSTLGQMTAVAKVKMQPIETRNGNSLGVRLELEPARRDDISCIAFQARMTELKPLILSVGMGELLSTNDFPGFRVGEAGELSEVERLLAEDDVAVLVFSPQVKPLELRRLLHNRSREAPVSSVHIVLYDEAPPSAFQDLVDDDQIFYLAHASIALDELRATMIAAVHHYARQLAPTTDALTIEEMQRVTVLCLKLTGTNDLAELAEALSDELLDVLKATQARCLFYDPQGNTLSARGIEENEQELISAAAGLVGYVARTGKRVRIDFATKDPRYDSEADSPGCTKEMHFIAQPVNVSADGTVGVLTATRETHMSPFTSRDEARVEALAERVGPLLQVQLANLRARQVDSHNNGLSPNVFRQEALEYHNHGEIHGKLLWGLPLWLKLAHWLIIWFLTIGIVYFVLARVHDVVTGPAVIRVTHKITVPSLSTGVVDTVLVAPGDRVMLGDLMVTLKSEPGDSLLERMREEVRAPAEGIISDVYTRAGQPVVRGDEVLSLSGDGSRNEVLALLPGSYAPQIHAGMPLVLKIDGYSRSREDLTILDVAPDLVGPTDATRYVGKEIAQTLSLTGPVVLVRMTLPQDTFDTFEATNEKFHYHDGMIARAEVSVRNESLIAALIPGIRQIYDNHRISLDRPVTTYPTSR